MKRPTAKSGSKGSKGSEGGPRQVRNRHRPVEDEPEERDTDRREREEGKSGEESLRELLEDPPPPRGTEAKGGGGVDDDEADSNDGPESRPDREARRRQRDAERLPELPRRVEDRGAAGVRRVGCVDPSGGRKPSSGNGDAPPQENAPRAGSETSR